MDRQAILNKVLNRRVKDYSYPIVFFLIFGIFVFFAIRPNLVTAFSLQKQLEELRLQDDQYETVILNIVNYQSVIETTREDFVLLDQAVPPSPEIFAMVRDIRKAATESGMTVDNMEISQVNLKLDEKKLQNEQGNPKESPTEEYVVKFQVASNFNEVKTFMGRLVNQRRLKVIDSINISATQQQGTQSATFSFSFVIEGYYL